MKFDFTKVFDSGLDENLQGEKSTTLDARGLL